jgi:group I intron endonuclease
MFYLIYKTINLIDGKYYVGCHQTEDVNDFYIGSGKHLKRAIKKYGRENFKKEILHYASSKEEMFEYERMVVNESLVNDPLSYNLKIGGSGGNPGIVGAFSGRSHSEETKEKLRQSTLSNKITEKTRKTLSENNWARKNPEAHREHMKRISRFPRTPEHNAKVAAANIGKILINNGIVAKRIEKNELTHYQSLGWIKGGLPRSNMPLR